MTLTAAQIQLIQACSKDAEACQLLLDLFNQIAPASTSEAGETRYQQLFEHSPTPLFSINRDRQLVSYNPACRSVFRLTEASLGQPYLTQLGLDEAQLDELVNQVFNGQSFAKVNLVYRRGDGDSGYLISRLYPLRDAQGQVCECVFANTDITHLRQVEQSLQRNEFIYRALFEQTRDAIFITQLDGRYLAMNQRGAELLGGTVEELIGQPYTNFVDPDESAIVTDIWQKVVQQTPMPPYERTLIRLDGQKIKVEVAPSLICDANGQPLYVQGHTRDITERKRTEQILRENEAYFRAVIETAQEGIWITTADLKILYVNQSLADLLGYAPPEVLDHSLLDYLGEVDRETVNQQLETRLSIRQLDVRIQQV
ncbi:MAG TPA: PAS domain S-box protein, partial [Phototrophicaceae bacterium]|nr:PAS domain S-box protein [Phototrophicaceae bacterium]